MTTRAHPFMAAALASCWLASGADAQCSPTVQLAHLFAEDGQSFNRFGRSLVWNVDGIFIGASGADSDIGAVYAFEGELPSLSQTKIRPSDLVDTWFFGASIAVDGEWMAVSGSELQVPGGPFGQVYIFQDQGGEWVEVDKLYSPSGVPDGFGSVALAGSTLFVGASTDDDAGPSAGALYVFELQSSQWVVTAKLTASEPTKFFAGILSVQEDRLLVGARGDDSIAGAVFVFEQNGGAWTETAKIVPATPALDDDFGSSLAQWGDTVIVGAPTADEAGLTAGAAYIFELQGAQWVQQAKLLPPEGDDFDHFGTSVGMSGDRALVGAPGQDVDGTNDGAVHVFLDAGASSWLYAEPIHHPGWDHVEEDNFGQTLVMVGKRALIGLPNSNQSPPLFSAGSAMLFHVPMIGPSEVVRLGEPPNPAALLPGVTGPPIAGTTWQPRIDHAAFLPGASLDLLGITAAPANFPTPFGTLLCDLAGPPPIMATALPGEPFAVPVPLACVLVGLTLSSQGASTDGVALLLSNALDLRIGQP